MKLIKENFDSSIDRERRIFDYKSKHLIESVEKEIKIKENINQDLKVSEDKAKVQLQGLVDQAKKVLGEVGDGLKADIAAAGFTLDNSGKVVKSINESTYDPIDKNEVKKVDNYYKQHYPEEYEDATTEILWSAVHTGNDQENTYFNSEAKLKDYIKRNKETLSTAVKGKYKVITLNGGKSSEDHVYIPLETPEVVWDNPAHDNKPVNKINEEVKKLPNGKWANVGKDGKANSGEFNTKKEAESQMRAMYANGYKGESLSESLTNEQSDQIRDMESGSTIEFSTKIGKVIVTRKEDPDFYTMQEFKGEIEESPVTMRYPEILWAVGKVTDLHNINEAVEEVEVTVDGEPMVPETNEHSVENVPEMPETNCKMIISNLINPLIQDELQAIDGYNSAVATIRGIMEDSTHDNSIDYEGIIAVISEITNEENVHIGQLEKLLEMVSPNAESIDDGKEEAEEQLAETEENKAEETTAENKE